MLFLVLPTRRLGVTLPRHQSAFKSAVRGCLCIRDHFDPVLSRYSRIARLTDVESKTKDLLQPLFDAYLVAIRDDSMTLAGFETHDVFDGTKATYAQTWVVTAVS